MNKYLAVSLFLLSAAFTSIAQQPLDKVIALVDEDVILESELDRRYQSVLEQNQSNQALLPDEHTLRYQILQRLIDESLQFQLAHKSGVKINEYQLNQAVEALAQDEQKSLQQFRTSLIQQGQSYELFREDIRKEMMINQIQQYFVNRRIFISDQEVSTLIKQITQQQREQIQVHLQHLFLPLDQNASEQQTQQQMKQANQIISMYQQGTPFQQLIQQYSKAGADNSDLGIKPLNELPSLFIEPVEQANSGDIVGPLRSGSGLHLLKVAHIEGQQKHFVEQVNARHILIKPSEILSDEHIRLKLADVRQQILDGTTTFNEKALALSEDPGSGNKGGELGWNSPQIYVPEFQQAVQQLQINEISEPFKSDFGWHIVQLLGKRQQDVTAQQLEQRARQIIRSRKFEQERQSWQQELRDQSFVEIVSPEFLHLELSEQP